MDKRPFAVSKSAARMLWRLYLLLALLQGALSLYLLLQVGAEPSRLSPVRLGFFLGALLLWLFFAWQLLLSWLKPARFEGGLERLAGWLMSSGATPDSAMPDAATPDSATPQKTIRWARWMLFSGLVALLGAYFITLTPEISEPFTRAYFDRLLPLIVWLTGLAVQTLLALGILRFGKDSLRRFPRQKSFYISLAGFGLLFLLWSWIAQESSAQESQITVWGAMGAPLLEWQVFVAWLAGMVMLALMVFLPQLADSGQQSAVSDQRTTAEIAHTQRGRISKYLTPKRLDAVIGLILWGLSITIWQSVPLAPNWFVTSPHAPNQEYYPNSDAQYYDITAQNALIGEGFLYFDQKVYVRRPMLALLSVGLHALGGQDYESVAFLQLFALALIIPLAYYLTRLVHNRISGVIAAVLIMLREANSIALTSRITTSNAKLIMADVPAMLAVLGLALAISLWFKNAAQRPGAVQQPPGELQPHRAQSLFYALFAGGVLGIGMLVRPEIILFSAVVAVISALIYLPRRAFGNGVLYRMWVKSLLVFALGIGLVLAPWYWRNWHMTGQLVLDSPIMRLELIVLRYRPPETAKPPRPETTPTAGSAQPTPQTAGTDAPVTVVPDQPSTTVATPNAPRFKFSYAEFVEYFQDETTAYIRKHPEQILRFIIAHFTHSNIQSLLILPSTFRGMDSLAAYFGNHSADLLWQNCCSTTSYIRRMPYWRKWDGSFPSQAVIPLLVNCLLIAAGIAEAWKRQRWVGLTPLLMSIAFFMLHAIFRNSGGRYILPTDWVSIFYFSIGLSRVSLTVLQSAFSGKLSVVSSRLLAITVFSTASDQQSAISSQPSAMQGNTVRKFAPRFLLAAVGLLAVGALLPAVELSIPKRYTEAKAAAMLDALYRSDHLLDETYKNGLLAFVESGGMIYPGRALYPIFYLNDDYEPGSRLAFQQDYSRLAFYLVGPISKSIVIPLAKSPAYFPNTADVLVFLCPDGKALAAAAFDPAGSPASLVWRSDLGSRPDSWVCPLPDISPDSSEKSP